MKKILLAVFFVFLSCSICFGAGQTSSGKTANDIITNVRQILNETTASFWTDAELLDWIDEAVKDIVSKSHCLEDTATIVLSTNTKAYSWSGASDYVIIEPEGVFFLNHNTSKYTKLVNDKTVIGHTSNEGQPTHWYEFGNEVHVWPVPTSAYSGSTIYADYIPVPTKIIATTGNIETPAIYDNAIVWYVVSMAKAKDKNANESAVFMKIYDELVNRYRVDITREPSK